MARTRVLVAPDGKHAAYSEAVARGPDLCAVTARLFVRNETQQPFAQVFIATPSTYQLGDGIELVDWSANSRYLLVQVHYWQQASDWGDWGLAVWDARIGLFEQPRVDLILEKGYGKACTGHVTALGFAPDNFVFVQATPDFDEEGISNDSCLKNRGDKELWKLNFRTGDMVRDSESPPFPKHGQWAARPVK